MSSKEKLKVSGQFNLKEPKRNLYKKKAWWQHPPFHNNKRNTKEQST